MYGRAVCGSAVLASCWLCSPAPCVLWYVLRLLERGGVSFGMALFFLCLGNLNSPRGGGLLGLMVGRSVVLSDGVKDGIGVYCLWVVEVVVLIDSV